MSNTNEPTTGDQVRRVVCAAIRSDSGQLLLGIRHYSRDMQQQIDNRSDGHTFLNRTGSDQGFVDQYGWYMTRAQAYDIANAAGQIRRPGACRIDEEGTGYLFSEALY